MHMVDRIFMLGGAPDSLLLNRRHPAQMRPPLRLRADVARGVRNTTGLPMGPAAMATVGAPLPSDSRCTSAADAGESWLDDGDSSARSEPERDGVAPSTVNVGRRILCPSPGAWSSPRDVAGVGVSTGGAFSLPYAASSSSLRRRQQQYHQQHQISSRSSSSATARTSHHHHGMHAMEVMGKLWHAGPGVTTANATGAEHKPTPEDTKPAAQASQPTPE